MTAKELKVKQWDEARDKTSLKELLKDAIKLENPKNFAMPHNAKLLPSEKSLKEHLIWICKDVVRGYYNDRADINFNEVEIWGTETELAFGNLYSFVLGQGIIVPYSNWIYDTEVAIGKHLYGIDKENGGTYIANTDTREESTETKLSHFATKKINPKYYATISVKNGKIVTKNYETQ